MTLDTKLLESGKAPDRAGPVTVRARQARASRVWFRMRSAGPERVGAIHGPVRWGQRVAAFVAPRAPVAEDALDAHCRASTLPAFKRPRAYAFVREIPKSPVGKVLRRRLVAGDYDPDP